MLFYLYYHGVAQTCATIIVISSLNRRCFIQRPQYAIIPMKRSNHNQLQLVMSIRPMLVKPASPRSGQHPNPVVQPKNAPRPL